MPHRPQDPQPLQDNGVVEDLEAEDERQEGIEEIEEVAVEGKVKVEAEVGDEEDMRRKMGMSLHPRDHLWPTFEVEALSVVG
jgi:hypothetical protein